MTNTAELATCPFRYTAVRLKEVRRHALAFRDAWKKAQDDLPEKVSLGDPPRPYQPPRTRLGVDPFYGQSLIERKLVGDSAGLHRLILKSWKATDDANWNLYMLRLALEEVGRIVPRMAAFAADDRNSLSREWVARCSGDLRVLEAVVRNSCPFDRSVVEQPVPATVKFRSARILKAIEDLERTAMALARAGTACSDWQVHDLGLCVIEDGNPWIRLADPQDAFVDSLRACAGRGTVEVELSAEWIPEGAPPETCRVELLDEKIMNLMVRLVESGRHFTGESPASFRLSERGLLRFYELWMPVARPVRKSAKKGGKKPDPDRAAKDEMVRRWRMARDQGVSKADFCEGEGIEMDDLTRAANALRNREARRKLSHT